MHIKTLGNTVLLFGILIVLAALFADRFGIGGSPGFGPGQVMGLIIGPMISVVGFKLGNQSD
jgi:hypothetical protein